MPVKGDTKQRNCDFCGESYIANWHGWKWVSHCEACKRHKVWYASGGKRRQKELDAQKAQPQDLKT